MRISTSWRRARRQGAFSITELMVASVLLVMISGGVLYSHIVGAKMYQLTKSKRVDIGSVTFTNNAWKFTECPSGTPQQAAAIQIFPTTNYTTPYVLYFLNTTANNLQRSVNGTNAVDIVAECITNQLPFTSETYSGEITTDNQNNRVIGLNLQFYQIQYPITRIGGGQYYDFYQLRTKIAKRTME
jgi:hypothetical protein